jgi:cytosine/adenosine deaminase-related metal-dependent hydrolase
MLTLRARYVFPVDRPPIENGVVAIKDGLIYAVLRFTGELEATDLGDVAILPGLVNAHTHLEFSDLDNPLGQKGMLLPWWIREVIKQRARAADAAQGQARLSATTPDPIERGIAESARCGVTTIGNITTELDDATQLLYVVQSHGLSRSATPYRGAINPQALDVAQYLELRALRFGDIESRLQQAAAFTANRTGAFFGLSPHAPYTVHQNLFHQLCDIATARRCPIAMHLAESREELQLLQTSLGPFRSDRSGRASPRLPQADGPFALLVSDPRQLSRCRRNRILGRQSQLNVGRLLSTHACLLRTRAVSANGHV